MKRRQLDEGDLWNIDSFDGPVDGYGATWVVVSNLTKQKVGEVEAADLYVMNDLLYKLKLNDKIMVFTSKLHANSQSTAFFIRTRDFFQFDAEVQNCSSWWSNQR